MKVVVYDVMIIYGQIKVYICGVCGSVESVESVESVGSVEGFADEPQPPHGFSEWGRLVPYTAPLNSMQMIPPANNMQESEYFNINNITDNGEDDKEEPPVPRACAAPSQNTADTVNSMLTDPLATGTQPKPCSTLDIHHFFKKHKGEHMVCVPCKNMKAWNPGQFPSDHMYMYSAVMSNTSLHFHIEKYYLEEFLAEAEHHAWVVQINSMRATFSIGYNYATLCEVLSHPNVSIHLLPLAPPPRPDDELPVFSGPRPPPLDAWREYFIILKRNMAVSNAEGRMKIPTHFSHSQPTG
ncbi:hypothetical protein EDD16DRAFT_1525209 [Pisolithus croceorrhizus]|nr:hypothetical protein EDD16DRAFT_1525209 [Pisolithus croceorrhizus]